MVEQIEVYALNAMVAWADWPDPGAHAPASTNMTPVEQRDQLAMWEAHKEVWDEETNVRWACITALNITITRKHKQSGGNRIGAKMYKANDDPSAILDDLHNLYGCPSPGEKKTNENTFGAPWNPSEPIEELYDRLEECYVVAIVAKPAYTKAQMIDKALIAIQGTGLFETAVL